MIPAPGQQNDSSLPVSDARVFLVSESFVFSKTPRGPLFVSVSFCLTALAFPVDDLFPSSCTLARLTMVLAHP